MKVLVQNTENWKYLGREDWADASDAAEDFITISQAQQAAETRGLARFRIVGCFTEPGHTLEIPITG